MGTTRKEVKDQNVLPEPNATDSGWIGAGPEDDLERGLEAADEPFDESQPHVLTVLGPIAPDALGVTLIAGPNRPLIAAGADPGSVLLVLEQLYAIGVRAIVDLASAAAAEQLTDLLWISARAPVHVINGASAATPIDGTAKANVGVAIGQAGVSADLGDAIRRGQPRFVPVAAAAQLDQEAAQIGSGEPDPGPWVVIESSAIGEGWNWEAALERGIGLALIVAAADSGAMELAASRCRELVDAGFGNRLILGYNEDPLGLMERFPVLLMEAGLPATVVRKLLVDNPARALTRRPA
jgi:hypothetical protein